MNGILLPPHQRKQRIPNLEPPNDTSMALSQGPPGTDPDVAVATVQDADNDLVDSGSEYAPDDTISRSPNHGVTESQNGLPEAPEARDGRRKRGGQRGKRKLKDMYLALDGSALIAFGMTPLTLSYDCQLRVVTDV